MGDQISVDPASTTKQSSASCADWCLIQASPPFDRISELPAAVSPLPLRAQERAPSDRELAEFNKNFLDTMDKFSNDKEVPELLGLFSVVSTAIYNCELIAQDIINPALLMNFWPILFSHLRSTK